MTNYARMYRFGITPWERYGEAAAASGASALEALAITARTFALANRERHRRDGFDLCTLTHCQVLRDPTPAMRAASGIERVNTAAANVGIASGSCAS